MAVPSSSQGRADRRAISHSGRSGVAGGRKTELATWKHGTPLRRCPVARLSRLAKGVIVKAATARELNGSHRWRAATLVVTRTSVTSLPVTSPTSQQQQLQTLPIFLALDLAVFIVKSGNEYIVNDWLFSGYWSRCCLTHQCNCRCNFSIAR